MDVVGDEQTGFTVELDTMAQAVRIAGKGFWTAEIARAFSPIVANNLHGQPRGTRIILDLTTLKPMRDEGQQAFMHMLTYAKAFGVNSLSILTASHLTKLQLLRIVKEARLEGNVVFI